MVGNVIETTTTYEPYGKLLAQSGSSGTVYGYTGEQYDALTSLVYLRARYYNPVLKVFMSRDPWGGNRWRPNTLHKYSYVGNNPVNSTDPSGLISEDEKNYIRELYDLYIKDIVARLNVPGLTNLSNDAFAAMIAAKILMEDATIYADNQPRGWARQLITLPLTYLRDGLRDFVEDTFFDGEISWGPANVPLDLAIGNFNWWEQNYACLGLEIDAVVTNYYTANNRNEEEIYLYGSHDHEVIWELQTGEGAVNGVGLAILQAASRARNYWSSIGDPMHELSAYVIALGVDAYTENDASLYTVNGWTAKGAHWVWVEAIDDAADVLGIGALAVPTDYLPYTEEEKQKLDTLQGKRIAIPRNVQSECVQLTVQDGEVVSNSLLNINEDEEPDEIVLYKDEGLHILAVLDSLDTGCKVVLNEYLTNIDLRRGQQEIVIRQVSLFELTGDEQPEIYVWLDKKGGGRFVSAAVHIIYTLKDEGWQKAFHVEQCLGFSSLKFQNSPTEENVKDIYRDTDVHCEIPFSTDRSYYISRWDGDAFVVIESGTVNVWALYPPIWYVVCFLTLVCPVLLPLVLLGMLRKRWARGTV
jgi:RHS repeat-associated protein